ncbi:hypothetical protein HLY00_3269 [Mycolicibacterium hippocampi]|uniref:Uncharacterized protein n=1 Tax=Mycolicibacterium hippocampi TaxID=659824 RepID=A0A850PU49_9MYCO|nr:hypothetical protein [Mycolicibacterium hippocampi]
MVAGVLAAVSGVPTAAALPEAFPDLDGYPAVDPGPYQVFGAHPSSSGWAFSTPSGLQCRNSLIPDLGVVCFGPVPGTQQGVDSVGVSLTREGTLMTTDDTGTDADPYLLLPTGSKFAAGNGVECAVISDTSLACLARKPDSWAADTPDPPDRHYGEHGFVVQPEGTWTF